MERSRQASWNGGSDSGMPGADTARRELVLVRGSSTGHGASILATVACARSDNLMATGAAIVSQETSAKTSQSSLCSTRNWRTASVTPDPSTSRVKSVRACR